MILLLCKAKSQWLQWTNTIRISSRVLLNMWNVTVARKTAIYTSKNLKNFLKLTSNYVNLCNKIKRTKGALNAYINVCTVVFLKMLSIKEFNNKSFLKSKSILDWWNKKLTNVIACFCIRVLDISYENLILLCILVIIQIFVKPFD